MISFKQWLEDAGEVHPNINDDQYTVRGVGSKWVQTDTKPSMKRKRKPNAIIRTTLGEYGTGDCR